VIGQFVFEMCSQLRRWRIYGVSIVCNLSKLDNSFFLTDTSKTHPVCFCFLTSNPILSVQFHYLYFLQKILTGTAGRYVHHRSNIASTPPANIGLLSGLVTDGISQFCIGMQIPKSVIRELSHIQTILPNVHDDTVVELTHRHTMDIPSQTIATKCIGYSGMDVLFSALSIPHIVQIFSILLLEKQVVFRSSNVHNMTLVLLCLRDLMKPFRYRGTFLTVLPIDDNFLTILDSPTPFACGLVKTEKNISIPGHVCVVDLDRDEIADPDSGPIVASGPILIERLGLLIEMNRADVVVPRRTASPNGSRSPYVEFLRAKRNPLSSSHSYYMYPRKYCFGKDMVDAVVLLFRDEFVIKLELLARMCFVTDRTEGQRPVTVFNKELFLESVEKEDREFYEMFVQTMMFHEFVELMTDDPAVSPLALSDASDIAA
jgi:hypothetical protein